MTKEKKYRNTEIIEFHPLERRQYVGHHKGRRRDTNINRIRSTEEEEKEEECLSIMQEPARICFIGFLFLSESVYFRNVS